MPSPIVLDPARSPSPTSRRSSMATRRSRSTTAPRQRIGASLATVRAVIDSGATRLRRQHRLRQARADPHRRRQARRSCRRNLILSHCAGTGPLLDDGVVRLILALKAMSLARGYSGVRPETVAAILALVERGVTPAIPAKGSVGASGDLAPLAHMAATLIGVGRGAHRRAP